MGDYDSECAAITAVSSRVGMTAETTRKGIRQWAENARRASAPHSWNQRSAPRSRFAPGKAIRSPT